MVKTSADRFQIGWQFEAMGFKRKKKELAAESAYNEAASLTAWNLHFSYQIKHSLLTGQSWLLKPLG